MSLLVPMYYRVLPGGHYIYAVTDISTTYVTAQ
jgi:hypothetical protein